MLFRRISGLAWRSLSLLDQNGIFFLRSRWLRLEFLPSAWSILYLQVAIYEDSSEKFLSCLTFFSGKMHPHLAISSYGNSILWNEAVLASFLFCQTSSGLTGDKDCSKKNNREEKKHQQNKPRLGKQPFYDEQFLVHHLCFISNKSSQKKMIISIAYREEIWGDINFLLSHPLRVNIIFGCHVI